ncbi:permease [Dictyobacter aurantiacus]|uniref:Membrane protein n=1 Tax=Dictyobacter aurantiacus TaxID=1936993 RepID=A0A401Z9A1_9CHLR|nr:membrane protein [Dictyobacter aurantiacus]
MIMQIINSIGQALFMAFSMFWEILWPLILGFTLSGIIQAVVSHQSIARALGGDSPKHLGLATLFGIASSSCSYAAVALARSIFQKGASFTAAMVFQLSSTNLVIELGIILIVLMGWQFMVAEYLGGLLMVILLALIFRLTLTRRMVERARAQAEKGMMGKMEGHAAMDMSVSGSSFWNKLFSGKGLTAVSNYFVMDWASVWVDIALGLLISGALAAWVPDSFWQAFFLSNNPTLAKIEGPLMGPLVAMVSFVCSVGNVPLAAVLWRGGISFGGVVSFIFADLIILPILDIYRKYYSWKTMGYILVTMYITMAVAGYVIEFLFAALGIIPQNRNVVAITEGVHWNYTTVLNIIFLVLAALMVIRFLRTGGLSMLKMMNTPAEQMDHHDHEHHSMDGAD